jgi:two-component system CheB/CheR fusion protein
MLYEAAMVRVALGEALCIVEKRSEGIKHFIEAEELFKRLDNKRELPHVYDLLSKYSEEEGDFKNALNYNRQYTKSVRYFFDVEKTKALTRAKKEFESEQKEKEAALLREKNEEIKHYVIRLESSNDELKQFAHIASHDLREPLRMITSYMKLLQKSMHGSLNHQQTEFMGFAIDGAKRMEHLIQDMLRLAKVDANPRIEKVRLSSLVEEVKLNLEMLIKEKNAIIDYAELPDLMADRTMTLQLLQNIIGNGIKYNESSCPIVHITYQAGKHGGEIAIADNGIGIPEKLRQKAFQIFQRLHTAKEYSGTGLGLAICKKIAESMGGKINITDNPSGGSIFHIGVPQAVIAA